MKKDFVKKIFICLVAFVVSFFCATPLFNSGAFALTNISNFNNDNDIIVYDEYGDSIVVITYPDGTEFVTPMFFTMNSQNNGQIAILFQPDNKDNYLGTASYGPSDILDLGLSLTFYLPRFNGQGYESSFSSPVTLHFGTQYGDYGVLGSDFSFNGVRSSVHINTNDNYFSFLVWNLNSYDRPKTYSGDFDQYDQFSVDYIAYVLQVLRRFVIDDPVRFNANSNASVVGQYQGQAFTDVETEDFLLMKNTVQNIINNGNEEIKVELDNILTSQQDTQTKIDELIDLQEEMLHYGEGSFDEMGEEMDSIVGDINNSNNVIEDVDKVNPDDAESSVDNIINDILDNPQASSVLSKIMNLFTSLNIISTLILISLAVGLIKYIFFGRGA